MVDREKIIKGLICCTSTDGCYECPYKDERDETYSGFCEQVLKYDVLAILKEQETKWIHREDLDFKDELGRNHFYGMCENCGFIHAFIDDFVAIHTAQYKYCPQCGRKVKWE